MSWLNEATIVLVVFDIHTGKVAYTGSSPMILGEKDHTDFFIDFWHLNPDGSIGKGSMI
jgi:hypothetical protein